MRYIGADLHKKSITFCVVKIVRGKTTIVERKRLNCRDTKVIADWIKSHRPCEVVVETTIGQEWFVQLCEPLTKRTVVAHASKLRIIAESTRKTDKIDAFVLAELLAKDMLPESWIPTPRVRQHRALVRRRQKVQSRITSVKNTIRAILTRYNSDRKDIFTRHGWEAAQEYELLAEDRWVLDDLWQELQEHRSRLRKVDRRLADFAAAAPLWEREARAILLSMPGVGEVTIETVLAELGDWRRFKNGRAAVSFGGLDPAVRESDGRRHDLKLSKAGSPLLRWVMIQLAHRVKTRSVRWSSEFERLSRKTGKKKATCAIARRLLLVMYAMLRDGKAYDLPAVAA